MVLVFGDSGAGAPIVQMGRQAMADRYAYLPLIGVFIMVVWSIPRTLLERRLQWRLPTVLVFIALLAACLAGTTRQLRYWVNNKTLFEHAVTVTSDNAFAQVNLAELLRDEGDLSGAVEHELEVPRLNPNYREMHHNLGAILLLQGKVQGAITQFQ